MKLCSKGEINSEYITLGVKSRGVRDWLSAFWAAITKYHRMSGTNNRTLFLTVLEGGDSKVLSYSVPGESFLSGLLMTTLLLRPHMALPLCASMERTRKREGERGKRRLHPQGLILH